MTVTVTIILPTVTMTVTEYLFQQHIIQENGQSIQTLFHPASQRRPNKGTWPWAWLWQLRDWCVAVWGLKEHINQQRVVAAIILSDCFNLDGITRGQSALSSSCHQISTTDSCPSMRSMRCALIFRNRGPSLKIHHGQCLTSFVIPAKILGKVSEYVRIRMTRQDSNSFYNIGFIIFMTQQGSFSLHQWQIQTSVAAFFDSTTGNQYINRNTSILFWNTAAVYVY